MLVILVTCIKPGSNGFPLIIMCSSLVKRSPQTWPGELTLSPPLVTKTFLSTWSFLSHENTEWINWKICHIKAVDRTKSKISACSDEPERCCFGCSKVLLQKMFPHHQVRPMSSWLDLLLPRFLLPQLGSCMPGWKPGFPQSSSSSLGVWAWGEPQSRSQESRSCLQ